MIKRTRVLIVDDYVLVRKGIRMFLSTDPCIEVVAEAENGQEAVRQARNLQPDVVLMDLLMPGGCGVEAIAEIKRNVTGAKIIVLTMFEDETRVRAAIKAGADGYLLKNADAEVLLQAIHNVQRGRIPLDPRVVRHLSGDCTNYKGLSRNWSLTEREKDVLRLVSEGLSNQEIAEALGISKNTAKAHLKSIFSKLAVSSRAEAAVWAMQVGLITPGEEGVSHYSQDLVILIGHS